LAAAPRRCFTSTNELEQIKQRVFGIGTLIATS
jgi:hypothetical protein